MRFILYYIYLRWLIRILFCAISDPIETVFVNIEGDFSGLLDAADEGVDRTKDKLEDLDSAGQKAGGGIKASAGIAGAAFGLAAGAASKLLDIVINLAVAIPQAFVALGKEAVQANAEFETFTTQFETLLGSSQAAKERLEELAQFGVETPFELPEIITASRQLQVFGGTALATGDNLRMIGDIAAGVNQPFQDVAFWIGRMYDAMQNGQPFGEASARLQEMGALSGDTRRKLEQMQKTGEDGAKIFAVFSEEVGGRFTGNMERLSGTFQGVMSNLADFRGNLLRAAGEPFFEEVRQSAIDFLDFLKQNEGTITDIATGIGELAGSIVRFVREGLQSFMGWLRNTGRAAGAFFGQFAQFGEVLAPIFNILKSIIGVALTPLIKAFEQLQDGLGRLDEALIAGAQVLAFSAAGWRGLLATLSPIGEVITKIGQALYAVATGDFLQGAKLANDAFNQIQEGLFDTEAGVKAMEDSLRESAKSIDAWINPVEEAESAIEDLGQTAQDVGDQIESTPLLPPEKIEQFTDQLINATEKRDEQLEKLEADHGQKIAGIIEDANEKALSIEEKYNDDLQKLADDSEKTRLKVIEDTRQKLADLSRDSDRQLADRRKEHNRDELRETEDHLRGMRRLQDDYLLDLEDAVRDRDAGAIVDLQRKFQVESSRREEDFQVKHNRSQEDFDEELDQIRTNEARQREEILAAQSQALEDIRLNEEEKRNELDIRRQEENDKLQQDLQEKLLREQENYAQRKQALDEALQQQLEAIAEGLSKEKDVTEEGAREILEKFDEYFGIGGDIDQLMQDFARRRKIRADISVAFQSTGLSEPETNQPAPTSTPVAPGTRTAGGITAFAEGGTLLANKPTLAMFGEAGPEVVQFTPMSQLSTPGQGGDLGRMVIEMTGSAPPGIGTSERDSIAAVLLSALQETGVLN